VLVAVPLGLAIGLAVGMLGGGGAVLAVPVAVYVLDQDVEAATTVSLVVVAAAALAGAASHARAGRVCWRHAATFATASLPGIVGGTIIGEAVTGRTLIAAFAVLMLTMASATWRKGGAKLPESRPGECPALRWRRDVSVGVGVGFLSGLFGVGGGFLIVPALTAGLAFSVRSAIGTSLAIITLVSAVGVAVHLASGRSVDAEIAALMGTATFAGAVGGAALSPRVPQRTLAHAFACLVIAVAGYLLVSVALLGGPPAGA
jgi:uncharacterized membrane protein YfcA